MMIKKIVSVVAAFILVIVAMGLVRAGLRWHSTTKKLLNSPEHIAELSVTPEPVVKIPVTENGKMSPVSIGYAEFACPLNEEIRMYTKLDGKLVVIEFESLSIELLSPVEPDNSENWDMIKGKATHLTRDEWMSQRLLSADPAADNSDIGLIDVDLFCAEVKPATFRQIFMMSNADFKEYVVRLMVKVFSSSNLDRIIPFESENWVGAVYLRHDKGTTGNIDLTTRDRRISQIILIRINDRSDPNAAMDRLWTFLSTYKYAFESCPSLERIKELMAEQGISPHLKEVM